MKLRELTEHDEAAFFAGLKTWQGESLHWFTFDWKPGIPYLEHLERLRKNARGEELEPDRVPASQLYGFVDGEIVGRVSIRHELNEYLRKRGGHLGYSVAPKFRRKGYASEMFRQSLDHCRGLGLSSIMITCDDANEASWRILEKVGAKLTEKFVDPKDGSNIRRYWLDI